MTKYTLFLTATQLKKLKSLAGNLSVSAHIRLAITEYLKDKTNDFSSGISPSDKIKEGGDI